MEETRQPPPEPLAIYAPPSYPRESDPLRSRHEKGVKVASHSVNSLPPSNGSSDDLKNSTSAEWLPYTLRLSLVWIPTALSLILALVVGLLYWRSHNNNGLCAESSAVTGWRFAPTLITVLWGQLITMLFNDIQRTEPFARLARPPGSVPPASRTILEGPRLVWTAFAHAFNKKHNGGKRSWIIIWASIVLVLSSVVVSLSSALLASEEVNLWRPSEMKRMIPIKDSSLQPFVERDTFFRTTGAILQNVTTSPWISDNYTVLPFWPSGSSGSPWDAQYQSAAQTWEAETMVFRNDMQCSPMKLAGTDVWSYENTNYNTTEFRLSIRLENQEGCSYNLSFNASDGSNYNFWDAGSWADLDSYITGSEYAKTSRSFYDHEKPLKSKYNDLCFGDEIMIMSSQWIDNDFSMFSTNKTVKMLSNLTTTSYLCQSSHTMGRLPVRVSTSATKFDVNFDIEEFRKIQQEVPASMLNTSGFVKFYTDPKWFTMIPQLGIANPKAFSGALLPIATMYDFNSTKMKDDPDLPNKAAKFQRRHFGELLRTSLDASGASQDEGHMGSTTVSERRITVRMEAAAALVALLAFCFVALLGIIWLASVQRRPLHLTHEPATVLGTVSLVASNPSVLASLRDLDQASTGELRAALKGRFFSTSHGHLKEISGDGELEVSEPAARIPTTAEKEIPAWIKIRLLLCLLFYIAVLIMAILVVHRFANESDLRKGFFTYHVNINALGRLGSFTPFSIVPTTLAVLFGLWWNALDVTFRVLQPYISMSQAPKEIHRGAYVSYQSSYWLWATGKAAKNRHWLLSLVTFGTFCAQAFVIATSALFEQGTGVVFDSVQVNKTLELRQTPHIRMMSEYYPPQFNDNGRGAFGYDYVAETLQELFGNLTNNWMYSAVIEATLNGSEPNWSADGWSFVPWDLSILTGHNSSSDEKTLEVFGSLVNVTLTTPALRGRVECHQPEEIRNGSTNWNTNSTRIDPETNKTVEQNMPNYVMLGTTLAPDAMNLKCCTNNTDPSRRRTDMAPLAIGYWTQDFANTTQYITGALNNFTVKWIHGDGANIPSDMLESDLYFEEIPKIQAVKCMPIFETSDAEIVVDKEFGKVLSYRILEDATVDNSAWTDNFVFHEPTDRNDPVFKQQVKSTKEACERQNYTTNCYPEAMQNLTTSYGNLFMNSLLKASRLGNLKNIDTHSFRDNEILTDNVFNIRNNVTGLTLDFMSYAAYVKAGRNPEAFLDKDFMIQSTKDMFTLFFQHYVSSTVSLKTGGWAYQPIGANLNELGAVVNGSFPQFNPDGTPAKKLDQLPAQNTNRTGTATMSTRVEVLRMNRRAVYLCVGLLAWLALTTIIVAALQRWYFGELRRNVETIADVLVLVAGSERLLAAVNKYGAEGLLNSNVKTRLGWFRTDDGRMRWGIEIVEDGEVLMN